MSSPTATLTEEQRYPGVNRAYDFVIPSYQQLLARFEAADNRITSILSVASSLTLAGPAILKSLRPGLSFESWWFYAGVAAFITITVLGIVGRIWGALALVNPRRLYNKTLHLDDWDFKRDAIFFAGIAFDTNLTTIRVKGNVAIALSLLFLLESLCFLMWMAKSSS